MKKFLDWYRSLAKWQREGLLCIAGSAIVWPTLGTIAALAYGIGVGAGFVFGHAYAEEKEG